MFRLFSNCRYSSKWKSRGIMKMRLFDEFKRPKVKGNLWLCTLSHTESNVNYLFICQIDLKLTFENLFSLRFMNLRLEEIFFSYLTYWYTLFIDTYETYIRIHSMKRWWRPKFTTIFVIVSSYLSCISLLCRPWLNSFEKLVVLLPVNQLQGSCISHATLTDAWDPPLKFLAPLTWDRLRDYKPLYSMAVIFAVWDFRRTDFLP